jgi:hypothetical protein
MTDATVYQLAARRGGHPAAEVAEPELLTWRADAVLAAAGTAINGSRRGCAGVYALRQEAAGLRASLDALIARQLEVAAICARGQASGPRQGRRAALSVVRDGTPGGAA